MVRFLVCLQVFRPSPVISTVLAGELFTYAAQSLRHA